MPNPIIEVRQSNSLENSSQNSPLLALEQNPLQSINLRYPRDLGSDNIYRHLMRISIYKQNQSKIGGPDVVGNGFDFKQKAGASKVTELEDAGGGAATVTVVKAGQVVLAAGKPSSLQKMVQPAGQGLLTLGAGAFLNNESIERKTQKTPAAYIALYMPESIIFTDRHDFDPVSVTDALGNVGIASSLYGGGGETGEILGRAAEMTGQFGNNITDVALFTKGYALNPQLEILYKGSKNREFVYQFKFAPRNQSEAEELKSIIRTLRYHAAPEYAASKSRSRYFVPPSEFEIEFFVGDKANRNVPRIGQCVLSSVDVNYAAAGQYSTFYDGMPVEVTVQLTFTETIVLTKEDIRVGY